MPTLSSIMADLKKKGTVQTRKTYSRHGMDPDRVLGVSIADLKVIAKSIKGQQALAQEFYATGTMEAMYLACLVADGANLSPLGRLCLKTRSCPRTHQLAQKI